MQDCTELVPYAGLLLLSLPAQALLCLALLFLAVGSRQTSMRRTACSMLPQQVCKHVLKVELGDPGST